MEFTPEQQAEIDSLIAAAKVGLFTQSDLDKKVTAEVDRRVNTGIQKGIETEKSKWEREYAEKANLTAAELAQKDYDDKLKALSDRESALSTQANKIEAQNLFVSAGIKQEEYSKFIDLLVSGDSESTTSNVTNFIESLKNTQSEIESRIKKEFSIVTPPSTNPEGNKTLTKDSFAKMTYKERLDLKQTNKQLYDSLL